MQRVCRPSPSKCCWRACERPRLVWSPELEQAYRPFGLIEDGDTGIVEDEPVIQNGRVLEKGVGG
jgi:hypothetical protein